MTDPKLTTDHHRSRGRNNARTRDNSRTLQSQAERFRQLRAKDESYWNRLFDGLGIEWTEQGDAQ